MARPRFIANLKRLWIAYKKRQLAGFTLIELLVSLVIAAIITVGLLSLVIELTDANQRDAARSETQRDMQAAINYISQELREAVFVYDGTCLQGSVAAGGMTAASFSTNCPGVVNHIPVGLTTVTGGTRPIPVLAFWRADPLPDDLAKACRNNADSVASGSPNAAVAGVPCVSGRSYTLVTYVLVDDGDPADIWQGRARLVRYQLSQFTADPTDGTATNTGYVDPLVSPNSNFQQWPYQLSGGNAVNAQTTRPSGATLDAVTATGNAAVLVDFVDDGQPSPPRPATITSQCVDQTATTGSPYAITPRSDASFNPNKVRSFYACVRGKTLGAADTEQGVNQEVQLFLAGNVEGRGGFPLTTGTPSSYDTDGRVFPIQTRVFARGILNKSPK